MAINNSGRYDEVDEGSYVMGTLSVSTTAVEAKVGASRLSGRQSLIIFNSSTVNLYYGTTGVTASTGIPIFPTQMMTLSIGDIPIFLIASTTGPYTAIIHEVS